MVPASREQYRRLGAVLHAGQNASGMKVVMIASAMAGEGKTLTASNLALTMSESYHRNVLLIDADLRRPSLDTVFGIVSSSGLSEGLASRVETPLNVCQVSPTLTVLPAGQPTHDPMAGLTSDRMRRLIDEAREAFDWVIIDTPPTVLLSDAHLLASMVDGTILVIRANETPFDLVKRATEAIGRSRILGVVLNGAELLHPSQYYNYYGYKSRTATAEGR
jgi:capsular exopolysaccharide synthesis family protein